MRIIQQFLAPLNNFFCLPIYLVLIAVSGCHVGDNYAPVVNAWQEPVTKQGKHTVQQGETLYSIAWRYGLDYRQVAQFNHIPAPYHVSVGQKLSLASDNPARKPTKKPAVLTPTKHKPIMSKSTVKWIWPTQGKVIRHFKIDSLTNKGIDIAGINGQPIRASRSGEVVYSGNGLKGYGNLILIKHDDSFLSAYAHNRKNSVVEGMKVTAGQKIAEMGSMDASTGILHFEIREDGKPKDPEKFLKRA